MKFFKTNIKQLYKILSILYLKKLKSHAQKNDFDIIFNDCVDGVIFNLTNSLDFLHVDNIAKYVKSLDIKNFLILSRFKHNNVKSCKQINFRDLKTFQNAQTLLQQRISYKLHIDQINYKKCFSMFH